VSEKDDAVFREKWQAELKRRTSAGQDVAVALREMNRIEQDKHEASLPPEPIIPKLGRFIFMGTGLIGFFWSLAIVVQNFGLLGLIAAFLIGPITHVIVPLYAGFVLKNWLLFIFCYGFGILGGTMMASGKK